MSTMREAALAWARKGYAVFPCHPYNKRPIVAHGHTEATTDLDIVEAWWTDYPDAMIGWPVGPGAWVLDVDPRHGGDQTLRDLEASHGALPTTYTVQTPSGGYHIYFQGDAPCTVSRAGAGLDTRGMGKGYVILPPSVAPTGVYRVTDPSPLAKAPMWLNVLLIQGPTSEAPLAEVTEVGEGGRNRTLFRYASLLRRQGLGAEEILTLLRAKNEAICDPPLPDRELKTIAGSASRYEPAFLPAGEPPENPPETPEVSATFPAWTDAVAGEEEWVNAKLAPRLLVDDYLFADVAQLVAPGSAGKTTLMLYEAVRMALQEPVWGLAITAPLRTLILTKEDVRERLVARLRAICEGLELTEDQVRQVRRSIAIVDLTGYQSVRLATYANGTIRPTDMVAQVIERYFNQDPPDVLVFDPLVSFGADESMVNVNEQVLIEAAREVIRRAPGVCVRLVHHTGKAQARAAIDDAYAGRGGSALADGSRMVTVLHRVTEERDVNLPEGWDAETQNIITLSRAKCSYAPPNLSPILIRRNGFRFEWAEVPAEANDSMEQVLAKAHQKTIELYRAAPGDRSSQIWGAMLKDTFGPQAKDLVGEMVARGWLKEAGRSGRTAVYLPAIREE